MEIEIEIDCPHKAYTIGVIPTDGKIFISTVRCILVVSAVSVYRSLALLTLTHPRFGSIR